MTRRDILRDSTMGFGLCALGTILSSENLQGAVGYDPANPMAPKPPPLPAKAKRVIHVFMNGGPSQVDTFDPKPALATYAGQALPIHLRTERATGAAFPSPFEFRKHGESGIEVSEIFSKVAKHADDLCVIRSMHTDVPNHGPSLMMMNTGTTQQSRPSFGRGSLTVLGARTATFRDSSCCAQVAIRSGEPRIGVQPSCLARSKALTSTHAKQLRTS